MLLGLAASSGGAGSSPASLRSMVAQETVVGLFRDLRGITLATNSRRTYGTCCLLLLPTRNFAALRMTQRPSCACLRISPVT